MFVRNKAWAAAAALSAALGVVSATAPQASAGIITVPYQTGYQLAYNSSKGGAGRCPARLHRPESGPVRRLWR